MKCGGGEKVAPEAEEQDAAPVVSAAEKKKKEGLYMSLFLSMKAADLAKNHFIFKGKFTFLSVIIIIDISMKFGSAEEGGGIFMLFKMIWRMGGMLIGKIKATIDVYPLDLEKLKGGDFTALTGITFALGLYIKIGALNKLIKVFEPVLKLVLLPLIIVLLIAIQVLAIALDIALFILEAVEKVLKVLSRVLDKIQARMTAKIDEQMTKLDYYKHRQNDKAFYADMMSKSNRGQWCKDNLQSSVQSGCVKVDGVQRCDYADVSAKNFPTDCEKTKKEWRKLKNAAHAKCCKLGPWIARIALGIKVAVLIVIMIVVVLVPQLIVKIMSAVGLTLTIFFFSSVTYYACLFFL